MATATNVSAVRTLNNGPPIIDVIASAIAAAIAKFAMTGR
jgi:hypothetical protein